MESLEEILKRSGLTNLSAGTATASSSAATAEDEYHCNVCDDARWLNLKAPVGTPEFGRVAPCTCQERAWGVNQSERLLDYSELGPLKTLTFDSIDPAGRDGYVEPSSFRRACTQAERFADRPAGWFTLIGPSGAGKTHLAAAIANRAMARGLPTRFVAVPELLDHLRAAFGPEATANYDELFDQTLSAPLLILNDLTAHSPSPWAEEKLDQILAHRYDGRMPTVIISSTPLEDLPDRLRSRITDPVLSTVAHIRPGWYNSRLDDPGIEPRLQASMTLDSFNQRGGSGSTTEHRATLREALKAAKSFAGHPDGWLYLAGPTGVGKTHLAVAIANARIEKREPALFWKTPNLLDHLRMGYSNVGRTTFDRLFDSVKYAELLILDDLGAQVSTPWAEEKLYQLIVHRHDAAIPTVITSRVLLESAAKNSKAEYQGGFGSLYSEAIASRLRDGLVVTERLIAAPDYRFRGSSKKSRRPSSRLAK